MNKNEILVLKYLADGQIHDEAPVELTCAQFLVALKSLEKKDMVDVSFIGGGQFDYAIIKIKGRAALDDIKDEEEAILNHILKKESLTPNQYALLLYYKTPKTAKNILKDKTSREYSYIEKSLLALKYLKYNRTEFNLYATDKGLQVLQEIDFKIEQERNQLANKSIAKDSTSINFDNILHIDENHKAEVAMNIYCHYNHGFYKDENGRLYAIDHVFDAYERFFGIENLKDSYTPEQQDQVLINELLPLFYGNQVEVISYIVKIKSINNNREKAKVTADFVNNSKISSVSCKSKLWQILNKYHIYSPTLNNWCKYINLYVDPKKME